MQPGLKQKGGFTLIETLVAFAILALAMSQLLAAAGGGAQNDSRADFLLRAMRLGQSQLAALGVDGPIQPGETSGRYDDGLYWSLSIEPYRAYKSPTGDSVIASFWTRLTISRPTPQSAPRENLTLTTLKIVTLKELAR
ncbi:MAG TPA: type II secretion system protein [Methylocystis sp.]|jgi:general secretion pathway protein I